MSTSARRRHIAITNHHEQHSRARELVEERGVRAARRAAILQAIESRSSDPDLSASTIAAELGITSRYVHRLLEETGRSFSQHVLDERLDKAARMLRDPRLQDRRVADIADAAGFQDMSYFSRAFRRRFGMSASDMRAAARDTSDRQ
jgi:AraC-like DNA-binding protein